MRFGPKKSFALIGAAAVATLSLTACSSDSDNRSSSNGGSYSDSGVPIDSSQSGQGCFTEMTPDQKAQMAAYANQQGATIQNAGNNADGTQDVCIVDNTGAQHYYRQNDGFQDYLFYSLMMRNAYGYGGHQSLLTYGLLSGDLDAGDYLALSLLTGIGSNGAPYHPYSYTSAGWSRQQSPVTYNNTTITKVTNVYYGKSTTPVAYRPNLTPPSGYAYAPIPKASNTVADVEKDATGKPVVKTVSGTSASTALKGAVKSTPGSIPVRVAPPKTNLGTSTGSATTGGGTGTSTGCTTSGSKPKKTSPFKTKPRPITRRH